MEVGELFENASLEQIKRGFREVEEYYECLICGKKIYKGIIYPDDGLLYEAGKYIRIHIEKYHKSVFDYLIQLDKKSTGLSEHQSRILQLFYQGKSDKEVQRELGIGSTSTIRNHRFALKEKERQAKVFLAIMELLKEQDTKHGLRTKDSPNKSENGNDCYNVTEKERAEVLKKYFPEGIAGSLKTFYMKEKNKLVVLQEIAKRFEKERVYTEKEVNKILEAVYSDYVILRRYLIEYGFLARKADGSQYWLKSDVIKEKESNMERKKELKQLYKEAKTEAGVYQIRNTKNHKILVVSTPNLKTINGKKMELESGSHRNKKLQKELDEFGKEVFVFEVLEVLEKKEDEAFNKKDELKKLEEKWLAKLQPYGERGYNERKNKKYENYSI